MNINIKSEIDSRVLLYPLIRVLRHYGSVIVISNNRQLSRLIDDNEEGGFRNVRVIVDEGTADDILTDYGIANESYDYILLDNVGAVDYDLCIVPLGLRQSESFMEDLNMLLEEGFQSTRLIQFGKAMSKSKAKERRGSKRVTEKVTKEDEYDPVSKFRDKVEDKPKIIEQSKIPTVQFPTYQNIEEVEATHRFYDLPSPMVDALYGILKDILVVDKLNFQREARKKDESSGYYK